MNTPSTRVLADRPIRFTGDAVQQPPILRPGDLFTVEGRRYMTFEFGTNQDAAMQRGYSRWPRTRDDVADVPWAFPHSAVISSTPMPRPDVRYAFEFGSVVMIAGYGWYRLAPDHNSNVRFEAV